MRWRASALGIVAPYCGCQRSQSEEASMKEVSTVGLDEISRGLGIACLYAERVLDARRGKLAMGETSSQDRIPSSLQAVGNSAATYCLKAMEAVGRTTLTKETAQEARSCQAVSPRRDRQWLPAATALHRQHRQLY